MDRILTLLYGVVAVIMLVECAGKDESDMVAATAKQYYDCLLECRYDDYVAGIDGADTIPGNYREQLRDNAKMFLARQCEQHKGVVSFVISDAMVDADSHTANAFLVVHYADSTAEQIVVPLVERNGVWKMR